MTHRAYKWLITTIVIVIVAIGMVGIALAQTPDVSKSTQSSTDKIEAALATKLATSSADYIVKFKEQADLTPAYKMGWDARGQFVYDTLRATADRTQAGAIAILDGMKLRHQTFFAGNELYVFAGSLASAQSVAALPEVELVRETRVFHVDPVVQTSAAQQGRDYISSMFKSYDVPVASSIVKSQANAPTVFDWGITDTKADQFWGAFGFQGDGIVVSNIDTGVDYTHDALNPNYKCAANPSDPSCWFDPGTADCTGPGGGPCDTPYAGIYHGTHTMGTMVAEDDPTLAYQVGMAPNAKWIACMGCPYGSCPDFDLFSCADWILAPGGDPANRPNVVNNSWGGGGGNNWYLDSVNAWRAAGVFPAFSAGNSYSCNSLGSPGDYQESFGSAAHDINRNIADFSSKGPSLFGDDPYTKPNLSAPGVDIISTQPGNNWTAISGTSMASPHTAGAVALLWSCNPSLVGQIDQTFQILQGTTDAAPDGSCGAPPSGEGNYTFGYGYLDVYNQGLLWCGSIGNLEGHVMDESANPINLAHVFSAPGPYETFTDSTGYYNMTMQVGTYDVTAEAFGYFPSTVTVDIVTDTLTTQDFTLVAAPSSTVSGYVNDNSTGWPLYAFVAIAGYPGGGVWTDPATGFYSVSLPDGSSYDFSVSAWVPGYTPEDRTIGPLGGDDTQNFLLNADLVTCNAPGYGLQQIYLQDFEASDGGYTHSGANDTWQYGAPTNGPGAAHSGAYVWATGLNGNYLDYEDSYLDSPDIDLSAYAGSGVRLGWWDWQYTETCCDYTAVQVSNDGGVNWNWVYGAQYVGVQDWTHHEVNLDASYAVSNFRVRFYFHSDLSVTYPGWFIDDVEISGACNAPEDGGLVVGNVYDTNLGMPLTGALVTNDSGGSTNTVSTLDPNVGDSFYTLFSPSGTHDFTASYPDYQTVTEPVDVLNADTVSHDFYLPSGYLVVNPTSLPEDVPMGGILTVPMTLTNLGDGAVNFEIFEKDRGFVPVAGRHAAEPLKPSGPAVNLQGSSSPDVRFQPMESRIDAVSILHITTTDTSLSIQRALNELGYTYDVFTGDNWTGIDFSPYDVVIIGMDGGAAEAPSIQKLRTDVIDQGKRLIFVGGTCWQGFANGVNQYLVLNDTNNYCWQVTNPPQWTVVDPSHPLADGLPLTYNYANFFAGYYALRATDPDLEVVSVNGEGVDDFFYKSSNFPAANAVTATGDLMWFINSAYSYYWQDQADFDVLKQIIFNSVEFSGADVPWLSESPVSGTIPGAAPLINLGHDFKAVDAGRNSAAVPSKPITKSSPVTAPDYHPAAPANPDAVLWDQPLSAVDPNAYVDQDFEDFPSSSSFLADDFTATNPWLIDSFFVPGGLWNGATDLGEAESLTWQIYADAAGIPAGDPSGGGSPPLWTITLPPTDTMVTITNGSFGLPSDVTLNLSAPLSLSPGTYWFVFYPTAPFVPFGQYGRQAADTTNGYVGQFINPGGDFGFGTAWQDWRVLGSPQQDQAFRIEGTVNVGFNQVVDVTFDATAIGQPGDYMASLKIKNDTPYGDLTVPVTMTVAPPADWGKLEGTVSSLGYCDAEHNPLEKAVVVIESSLGVTYTLETDANGYYSWWLDSDGNDYTVSVTYPEHQDGLATGVVIVGGGTTIQNFDLRWLKACMSVDPTSLEATLDFGQLVTQTIDLTNDGAAGTPFEITEQDRGMTPGLRLPKSDGNFPRGTAAPSFGPAPVSASGKPAQASPILLPQGTLAYSVETNNAYFTGFDLDVPEELPNLAPFSTPGFPGAGEYIDGYIYITDGSTLYQLDPTGAQIGTMPITPPGGAQSYTGMALDPTDGTVYLSSCDISSSYLYTLDVATGTVTQIGQITNSPCTIAIAVDGNGDMYSYDIVNDTMLWIDKTTGDGTVLGPLGFDANFGQGMGWDQATDTLYLAAFNNSAFQAELRIADRSTGNTTLVGVLGQTTPGFAQLPFLAVPLTVGGDVPWLREDPTTGYLDADGGTQTVDVTFDANYAGQPGTYYANLRAKTDDPMNGSLVVPVTMTINAPADWGKLEGTVTSLGYCDVNPVPAEDASVLITSSSGVTHTLTTDAAGYYTWWLDEADSPYTVSVTFPDHEDGEVTGVVITGGETETVNFDLRWLVPCVSTDPTGYNVEVGEGYTLGSLLTLFNDGAAGTPFELKEQDQGMTPGVRLPKSDGNFPRGTAAPSFGPAPVTAVGKPAQASPILLPNGTTAYSVNAAFSNFTAFDLDVPEVLPNLAPFSTPGFPGAGEYVDGYIYITDGFTLYQLDPTGAQIGTMPITPPGGAQSYTGMALDPTDGTVYLASCDISTSYLYTLDVTTGEATQIGLITNSPCTIAIAVDGNGDMYSYDIVNDTMLWIDKTTGDGTVLGPLGFDANFGQGMGWDQATDTLYLAAFNNSAFQAELRIADRSTGNTTLVGVLGQTDPGGTNQLPFLAVPLAVGGDVPWLSEDPITGTIDADNAAEIDVTFDSMTYTVGTQLYALLKVKTDDPMYGTIVLPVTMTITAPAFGVDVGPDQSLSGRPTETVTYQVTVMNASNGPTDTFDITVGGNTWTTTAPATVGPLAPGDSQTIDVTVEIPADAAPGGSDVAVLTATSQGDSGVSDSASLTTMVTGEYEISLEPSEDGQSGAPGDVVTYTLTLSNLGDAPTTVELTFAGNFWDVSLPQTSFDLDVDESVEVVVNVTIPADAGDGDTDGVTVTATGLGGATDSSLLTTTAVIPTRFIYLPLVMQGLTQ